MVKPLSELSPAYRARIERGLAAGKTRQQSRGKKSGEHIERKSREVAKSGLTSSQKQTIKKYVTAQIERYERTKNKGDKSKDFTETYKNALKLYANNYEAFQVLQKVHLQNLRYKSRKGKRRIGLDLHEMYMDMVRQKYAAIRGDYIDFAELEDDIPLPEFMLYYN
jgi:hypothetical protein